MFQNKVVFLESTTWTPPDGVTTLRVIIGQGSQGSTAGADGSTYRYEPGWGDKPTSRANDGTAGSPGKIWYGVININGGVPLDVFIGKGSSAGAHGANVPLGEESSFGVYSSANGKIYENGYTDIASGDSYGRSNVQKPIDGTSDGPVAGVGGYNEIWQYSYTEAIYDDEGKPIGSKAVYDKISAKTNGSPGVDGADGFVVVYWDKPEVTT